MIKIYVANLKMYTEGRHVGKWIKLPCYDLDEQIDQVLTDNGKLPEGHCEEVAIHSYEAPFSIGEYEDIEDLNNIAETIENENISEEVVEALSESLSTTEELINVISNGDYSVIEDVKNDYDLGMKMDRCLMPESMQNMINAGYEHYVDFEAYGRDLVYNDEWHISSNNVAVSVRC